MSDDIDIEEHDVLDNPRIRNIFPDISSIKTEVEDYEENDTSIDIEDDYLHTTYNNQIPIILKQETNVKHFINKVIIGTKPSPTLSPPQGTSLEEQECTSFQGTVLQGTSLQETVSPETSYEESNFEGTSEQIPVLQETSLLKTLLEETTFPNKIILGSKTFCSTPEEIKSGDDEHYILDVSVVIEDCRNFLDRSPCFCKECEILFATTNDLDSHKMATHSFLVAVNKNKAVKSTSKSYEHDSDPKSLLCNHCNIVFPNTIALLRHTYELLPSKYVCDTCDLTFENETIFKAHNLEHNKDNPRGASDLYYVICKFCSCHFKLMGRLRAHLKTFHTTCDIRDVEPVQSDLQCRFCTSQMGSVKAYNNHILMHHSNYYYENQIDYENISKFPCPKCNLYFSSDYSVRIHLAAVHRYSSLSNSGPKTGVNRKPVLSKHLTNFSNLPKLSEYCGAHNISMSRPLPKSTLFQCNKCSVHFISCHSAVIHARTCVEISKYNNYQCDKCHYTLKRIYRRYHDYQHTVSDEFKIIEIGQNILNRILCKCINCEIYFDEKSFMTHHMYPCDGETPSVQCKECKIWIYDKALAVHKNIHAGGLKFRDFIITEYMHAEISKAPKSQIRDKIRYADKFITTVIDTNNTGATIKRTDKKSYYYCPTCQCYMKVNKHSDRHNIGQCNTQVGYVTCKSCGLRFTHKGFINHQTVHKMFPKLKLKDMVFTNLQNGTRILPPFPIFKKCSKCSVHFFSHGALSKHVCNSEESKICKYCKENFSDLAFKLHLPYHEYAAKASFIKNKDNEVKHGLSKLNDDIPEIIRKYKSLKQVWNIVYLCQSCSVVIDDYDKVVEHCQDHFCNMQSYNVTIEHCTICDLNFVDDCFKRHEKLHLNDDMDKKSFIILEYKYENLLLDSWMDMFKSLTKEQTQLILSKSMYMFTRCVRMKEVTKGSMDMTLYQCQECRLIVAPNKVMEHSQNVNNMCDGSRTFSCSLCDMKFAYKAHKIVHENLHEIRNLDENSFRIVEFYADKQFTLTEVENNDENIIKDEKNNDPEDLKFIRCQHCGKLINKNKYKSHVQYHEYYNRSKSKAMHLNSKAVYNKVKAGKSIKQNSKKILNFYVCRECKVCVAKSSIKVHICDSNGKKKKCAKCSLLFRVQNFASHYKSHEKKKFNRTNINVMYFDGDVIDKKPAKKACIPSLKTNKKFIMLYECSQCTVCIWNKCNLPRHVCLTENSRYKCNICGFSFHSSKQSAHKMFHKQIKFDSSNLRIIKFNSKDTSKLASPVPDRLKIAKEVPTKRKVKKRHFIDDTDETVSKKSKLDSPDSIGDFVVETNKYYKCETCKLIFVSITGLIEHRESCESDRRALKCNKCGLVFHESTITDHYCETQTKRKFYILTIKQLGEEYHCSDNWIIQCVNCDMYNASVKGYRYHLTTNHECKYETKTCEICNIKFTSNGHAVHRRKHHNKDNTDIADISIASIEDTTLSRALLDLPNDNDIVYADSSLPKPITVTPPVEGIYPCDVCGLNFLNPRSLIKHKYKGAHWVRGVNCDVCGLIFSARSLGIHKKSHCKNSTLSNIDQSNNSIENGEEDTEEDDVSQLSVDTQDDKTDEEETDALNYDDESKSVKTYNVNSSRNEECSGYNNDDNPIDIYTCEVCNLNFLHPSSLLRHKKTDKHNERPCKCQVCGLIFSFVSLKKHMEMHHSSRRTKKPHVTDSDENIINITKISKIFDMPPDPLSEDDSKNVALFENNMENSNFNNLQKTTNDLRGTSDGKINKETVETSRINENVRGNVNDAFKPELLNKNKLFKCHACNVYFLTAEDCSEHTSNHVQLDTFEYIGCKICDLQFCCEFLGRHMKSHREKTFSTDDLIVAEYFPNKGDVKIDTYLFVDRLKTKLDSTTASDNDVVDSTTESIVESQSAASIDDA